MDSPRTNARGTRSIARSGPACQTNRGWPVLHASPLGVALGMWPFVIAPLANRIVGWTASTTRETRFVLDAFEQAVDARRPAEKPVHPSDRNRPAASVRDTERLFEPLGDITPIEAEETYEQALKFDKSAARNTNSTLFGKPGPVHLPVGRYIRVLQV